MWIIERKKNPEPHEMPFNIVDHDQGTMVNAWTLVSAIKLRDDRNARDYPDTVS